MACRCVELDQLQNINVTLNITFDEPSNVFLRFWYIFFARDVLLLPPTTIGNILVLLAVARFPKLCRGTSGILIGNLALADLLMGVLVFPVDMGIRVSDDFAELIADCALYQTLVSVGLSASVLNLFLLSVERCHAVMRPLHHSAVLTKRRVYVAILAVWLFVVIYGCLSMLTWHNAAKEKDLYCPMKVVIEGKYYRILSSIIVITIVLNTIFLIAIARVVLRKASSMNKQGTVSGTNGHFKKDIRHTAMMLVVSGLFILFWGPFCIIAIIPNQSETLEDVHVLLAHIGVLNSSSNWIIYGWRSRRFRKAFELLLKCQYTYRTDSS